MSVSSVSGSSSIWEEYLAQLNAKRQQAEAASATTTTTAATTTTQAVSIDMGEILAELQKLEDDPDALKTRAAELAAMVSEAAESASGIQRRDLQEMAKELSSVAEHGDLSVLTDKAQRPMSAGFGPSGLSGSGGASMKWLEALLAEEDEDEDDETAATTVTTTTTAATTATTVESVSLTSLEEAEEAAEDTAALTQKLQDEDLWAAMKASLLTRLRSLYVPNQMEASAFNFSA
ncbi:MAG: hypothetical protein LBT15_07990 [Synergistaceae bacterium]|nr:hypothetical protein [Synergistaceae bacterium]